MFPLRERTIGGYKFRQKTSYSAHHLGVDYRANYVPLFAPFDGVATTSTGTQGGRTISFKPDAYNVMIRFMHLSEMKSGRFKQGDIIGTTGNSGSLTTAPHLHLDIATNWSGAYWKNINNFIDPETFNWGKDGMLSQSDVNDRTFTYKGMGLVWVKGEWIGKDKNDTSKPFPNTLFQAVKPLPVDKEVVTVTVEKPVIVEINKLTDEEIKQVERKYIREHPPTTKVKYVYKEATISDAFRIIWQAIKKFLTVVEEQGEEDAHKEEMLDK